MPAARFALGPELRHLETVESWQMRLLTLALLMVATAATAQADDRDRCERRHENHNYIIERQQAGLVQGVPTTRRIIGRREIDGYRLPNNGGHIWFEGDHVVGITR